MHELCHKSEQPFCLAGPIVSPFAQFVKPFARFAKLDFAKFAKISKLLAFSEKSCYNQGTRHEVWGKYQGWRIGLPLIRRNCADYHHVSITYDVPSTLIMDDSTTIGELKEMCRRFIQARDWQRDGLKDLTLAMSIEVGEILEHLRFKSDAEIKEYLQNPANLREVGLEVADVFYFLLTICLQIDLDLASAYKEKMVINEQHYPAHLAKGSNKKWTHYLNAGASDPEQIGLGKTGKRSEIMAEPIRNPKNEQTAKFGHYLRELRKQLGLTLREIEERTGISNSYLSQLETGQIEQPSPRNLQKLAEVYGISYEGLMTEAGYLTFREEATATPRRAAFNIMDDLSEDEVAEVQDFVKFLRFKRQQQRG